MSDRLSRLLCVGTLALIFGIGPCAALAEEALDRLVHCNIPAHTTLEDALIEWGTNAGVTVMINAKTIDKHVIPHGVQGTLTARKALSLILEGSGFSYTEDGGRIRVIPIAALSRSGYLDTPLASTPLVTSDFEGSSPFANQESGLPVVLVTAQKVTQSEQDVPATIGVLSGEQLESQGLFDLIDYAKVLPGLTVTGGFGPGYSGPIIRGMATGSGGPVSFYLDDIPFSPSGAYPGNGQGIFDPDVADIDHIEVVEGPQSTLYGAAAEGGIIKYVTRQPDLTRFTGSIRIDGSQVDNGGAGYGLRASINIPVVEDQIAVRASVFYRLDPGFINNDFNGSKNVNRADVEGGRIAALFKISDEFETTVSGLVQHIYTPGIVGVYLDPQTLRPSSGDLTFTSPQRQSNTVDTRAIADVTKVALHFATLTNIVSYANIDDNLFQDFSVVPSVFGASQDVGEVGQFVPGSNRLTDELRLTSAPGHVEYLLGVFYTHERDHIDEIGRGTNAEGQALDPASSFFNMFVFREDYRFHEWALFGDLTYHLTDQIEATIGMRHSANSQSWQAAAYGLEAMYNQNASSSDSSNSYLATISYKPESNMTLYLRAASAYRPGFPQFLNSLEVAAGAKSDVGPDSMWNYEAGVKGSLFDQRVVYAGDVFHMRWTDLQLNIVNGGFEYGANTGSAQSDGVEASLQFMPLKGLTVSAKGAYINARVTSDIPAINAASGQAMPYSPRWAGATVVDYRWTAANGISPTFGLTYGYHGPSNTAFAGATGIFGTGGIYTLPSYATLDFRAGFDWSRYSFLAHVDNVTNKYGLTSVMGTAAAGTPLEGTIIQPRTFGISISARF